MLSWRSKPTTQKIVFLGRYCAIWDGYTEIIMMDKTMSVELFSLDDFPIKRDTRGLGC